MEQQCAFETMQAHPQNTSGNFILLTTSELGIRYPNERPNGAYHLAKLDKRTLITTQAPVRMTLVNQKTLVNQYKRSTTL